MSDRQPPETERSAAGPLLRIFEVTARPGCVETILENFATSSADVVRDAPGNQGFFFGRCLRSSDDVVLFVSVWTNLAAVQERFGAEWEESYLPAGYEALIDHHTVRHVDTAGGWYLDIDDRRDDTQAGT